MKQKKGPFPSTLKKKRDFALTSSHSTWSSPTFTLSFSFPPARNIPVNHIHHLARISIVRQPLPVIHAQDFHPFVIHQIWQQFGSDQEILSALGFASHIDHWIVHHAFGSLIHSLELNKEINIQGRRVHEREGMPYLIDLVHEGKGCTGFFCQTHKI